MEEKKKRWRPTIRAYRALERQVIDLKMRIVNAVHVAVSQGEVVSYAQFRELLSAKRTLEQSNRLMEDELIRLRKELERQRSESNKYMRLWKSLKNRKFWARVFNRNNEESYEE